MRSKNKSGGKQDAEVDSIRKKANAPKGRHKQKRGGSSSGATAKYAKAQKNPAPDFEF